MADILLKGGKMLNRSCPECNAPLFRYQDRTFCAKCNWEEGETGKEGIPVAPPTEVGGEIGPGQEPLETLSLLQATVLERIRDYSKKLNKEQGKGNLDLNIQVLSELLELLDRILEIKKSMNSG